MSYEDVQVLIATINRDDLKFLEHMNLQTSAIVANQCERDCKEIKEINDTEITICSSKTRGAARNRNIALSEAKSCYCIIADDDVIYVDRYPEIVRTWFHRFPDADLIIFNVYENPIVRYIIKRPFRVNHFNYMRFGAVRIVFHLDSIKAAKICFDENFGPGTPNIFGEDTIFLHDCLEAGLKIYAVPEYLLSLVNTRKSTWFTGFNTEYFICKARLFHRLSPKNWKLLCFQDLVRHQKEYNLQNPYKMLRLMFNIIDV